MIIAILSWCLISQSIKIDAIPLFLLSNIVSSSMVCVSSISVFYFILSCNNSTLY